MAPVLYPGVWEADISQTGSGDVLGSCYKGCGAYMALATGP